MIFISIHLMLLFILCLSGIIYGIGYFNTSHVTVYQMDRKETKVSIQISIHLMLLFISPCVNCVIYIFFISIHLMLLFIEDALNIIMGVVQISIHLMLLFISHAYEQSFMAVKFQYISCYCLSR